jgi:dolichol-phosphate mannosyltransferase
VIYVLLPAYNEATNISNLLRMLSEEYAGWLPLKPESGDLFPSHEEGAGLPSLVHVIVVNDGSADSTGEQARSFQDSIEVTVLEHESNRGLGAALSTGISFILERCHDDDFIFTLDADCTHHPRYIFQLLNRLNQGFDIVVASRFVPGGKEVGVRFFRRLLSHGAGWCYRLFLPSLPLRDFSCGFRGIRASILRKTYLHWNRRLFEAPGFACTGELMLKMLPHTQPHRVTEIPFELHYEQKGGKSKMPALQTILGTLMLLMRARRWFRKETP